MIPYSVLERLPAEAYLHPSMFTSPFDTVESDEEQYNYGLALGRKAKEVFITNRGTWGAEMLNGGQVTAPEGIGYHRSTAALLRGFLDSDCTIHVYRNSEKYTIK